MIDLLDDYLTLGFSVIPVVHILPSGLCSCGKGSTCRTPGKHPHKFVTNGVNGSSNDRNVVEGWCKREAIQSWGVRTGTALPNGKFLCVVDIDPRNGGDDSLAALLGEHGAFPATPCVLTGGGGQHYYFQTDHLPGSRTLAEGIDFKGQGGYVLAPPSLHRSGNSYVWDAGAHIADTPLADLPQWCLDRMGGALARERPETGEADAGDSLVGEAFRLAGWLGQPVADGKWTAKCPWSDQHTDGRGKGDDASCVILPPIAGSHFGSFCCMHSHCRDKHWGEVSRMLPMDCMKGAMNKYPQVIVATEIDPLEPATPPPPVGSVLPRDIRELLSWKHTKGGDVCIADGPNVVTMLTHDHAWQTKDGYPLLQWDEFMREIRFVKDPPWYPDDAPGIQKRTWEELDGNRMHLWFKRRLNIEMTPEKCYVHASTVAARWSVHPVRVYFDSLEWDGVNRLDTWLTDYLGTPNDKYHTIVGRMWLLSAVARIMAPGAKADSMLILEGAQGIGKSTALEILAVDREWFSDTPFVIGDKDSYLGLRGKLIVEIAELEALNKSEADKQKAFFSANSDSYRQPYDRKTITVPRQCVFAGTTNQSNYLRDETGARRFWPVECSIIDLIRLKMDRDQLWAEAVARYLRGDLWYTTDPEERKLLEDKQVQRTRSDLWESEIGRWLETPECGELMATKGYITASDVVARALEIPVERRDQATAVRVGMILSTRRDWQKSKKYNRLTNRSETGYTPCDPASRLTKAHT